MKPWLALLLILALWVAAVGEETKSSVELPQALKKLLEQSTELIPKVPDRQGPPLTLQECYDMALTRHPILLAQKAQIDQAKGTAEAAWAQFDPSVAANVNRTWLTLSPFNLPVQVSQNQTQAALNITQTLTDSGVRRAQAEAAEWQLRSTFYAFHKARLDQFQLVQSSYVQVVTAELLLAIQKDNYDRTRFMQDFAIRLYNSGQKSMIDVSQATTQTAQAEVNVDRAQNQVQNARVGLAQAIGIEFSELKDRPVSLALEDSWKTPQREQALPQLDNNPALLSLEAQARSLESQAEQKRKTVLPSITGGVQYGLQGLETPSSQFWQIGLTLSVPFYQPGVKEQVRSLEANAAATRFNRDSTRLQLLQQLDTAYSDLAWTRRRAESAKREVELARANLTLAYKRYRAGLADITEQINARSFVNGAQNDYVAALSDRKLAEGRLLQVLGQLPVSPDYDHQNPEIPLPALPPEALPQRWEISPPLNVPLPTPKP